MSRAYLTQNERITLGPSTQEAYEDLIEEIANLRMQKVQAYGESYYHQTDGELAMLLVYADLKRKFARIENSIKSNSYQNQDGETLREALKDTANYALMGMQLLDQHFPQQAQIPVIGEPRIDQLAFYSKDPAATKSALERIFARDAKWHDDIVQAAGKVYGNDVSNTGRLSFNYDLSSIEFEVLNYSEGRNWLEHDKVPEGLSHLGVHVEDLAPWIERMEKLGYVEAQELRTYSHTNPEIRDTRRYHYIIYNTVADLGFYLKLIQRLPVE